MRFAGDRPGNPEIAPISLGSAGSAGNYSAAAGAVDIGNSFTSMREKAPKFDVLSAEAMNSTATPWQYSENERHTREIQSIKCDNAMAFDHTHQVVKNYRGIKRKAKACFTLSNELGQIACVVLVPSTKAKDYAHAATLVIRRKGWRPKVVYSDIWPAKDGFWEELLGEGVGGCLGL